MVPYLSGYEGWSLFCDCDMLMLDDIASLLSVKWHPSMAVATIWLFLTSPVTVATAVNDGEISPFVRQLADVLLTALAGLLRYF